MYRHVSNSAYITFVLCQVAIASFYEDDDGSNVDPGPLPAVSSNPSADSPKPSAEGKKSRDYPKRQSPTGRLVSFYKLIHTRRLGMYHWEVWFLASRQLG